MMEMNNEGSIDHTITALHKKFSILYFQLGWYIFFRKTWEKTSQGTFILQQMFTTENLPIFTHFSQINFNVTGNK